MMDDPRVEDALNTLQAQARNLADGMALLLANATLTGQLNPGQVFALKQAYNLLWRVVDTIEDTRPPSR